ncbi:hypothetical protein QWA_18387 [Alcaligenes faecalis subsp. faecalis NCIB 8687]|nr:hypothetical protein QWA_18387 [Alcaligenes faecalis subsp. faecalis NCIB 8687]
MLELRQFKAAAVQAAPVFLEPSPTKLPKTETKTMIYPRIISTDTPSSNTRC